MKNAFWSFSRKHRLFVIYRSDLVINYIIYKYNNKNV